MKPTIFIHTNPQQLIGAKISEYSLRKMSKYGDRFDIKILNLEDYPCLLQREGQSYLRKGSDDRIWRNRDLQSFTPLRFLPPQLMGYQGRAMVIDPDVFALADIYELLTRDMKGKAILCRKFFPANGETPYYSSSVMLLDCSQLKHWQWERQIEDLFALKFDYQAWITLSMEPEDSIGDLEAEWNHYDTLNEDTKLVHNNRRLTQPWKTGLPIDFTPKKPLGSESKKWGIIPREWIKRTKAFLKGTIYYPSNTYQPHPDSKQEEFFFGLFKECFERGILTEEFIRDAMGNNYLRKDAMSILSRQA